MPFVLDNSVVSGWILEEQATDYSRAMAQRLQALGVRYVHAAELAAPEVVAGLRESVPAAQLLDRNPGIRFLQKTNDLFFASDLRRSWSDSKSRATQAWGNVAYIPLGNKHWLDNPGKIPLEIIEVQTGSYVGEDDICAVEDIYGR